MEKDPELQATIRWRVELETQCDDRPDDPELRAMLEDQGRKVNNLRRCLQDRRRKEVRREFSRKQAVVDIERQLTGGSVSDEPAREVLRKEFTMPPEQILLVETFFTWPTPDSLEDEWVRRNRAVAAGIQYCGFQEGGPLRGRPKRTTLGLKSIYIKVSNIHHVTLTLVLGGPKERSSAVNICSSLLIWFWQYFVLHDNVL